MELKALIDTATRILSGQEAEQQLELIEKYTDLFSAWYQDNQELLDGAVLQEQQDSLRELLTKHQQVLEQIATLREGMAAEMGGFHKRAKGIMAYADTLPRKISIHRTRKG